MIGSDEATRWNRKDGAAVALLAAFTLCLFRRALFSPGLLLGHPGADLVQYFFFNRYFAFKTLSEGFPLWNPHVFFGVPFLAQLQSALLYPLNYLITLLPIDAGLNWTSALHVFIAGAAMYAFVRYASASRFGALVSGLAYMAGSGVVLRVYAGHLNVLDTAALLPLLFLAAEALLQAPGKGVALAGAILYALTIFAGYIQLVFFATVALGVYGGVRLFVARRRGWSPGALPRTLIALGGMVGVGALLAAVQLVPTLELGSISARSGEGYAFASVYSFPPESLLTIFFPGVLGDGVDLPYWGRWDYIWEMSLYTGAIVWMAALAGAIFLRTPTSYSLAAMGLFSLVLALGKYTPALRAFVAAVPGADIFRGYSKFGLLFLFAETALAGIWLGQMVRGGKDPSEAVESPGRFACTPVRQSRSTALRGPLLLWAGLALACLLALIALRTWGEPLVGKALAWIIESGNAPSRAATVAAGDAFRAGLVSALKGTALAALLFLLLLGYSRTRLPKRAFQGIALSILVFDVWTFASPYATPFPADRVRWPEPLATAFEQRPGPYRMLNLRVLKNQGMLYGVDAVGGFEAGIVGWTNRYLNLSQGFPLDYYNAYGRVTQVSNLLGAANCRYILLPEKAEEIPIPLVGAGPGWALYEEPRGLPRAYCVFAARIFPDDETTAGAIGSPSYDPLAWAALAGPADVGLPGNPRMVHAPTTPTFTTYERGEVALQVEMPAKGLLVLTDAYYPGWEATVDGEAQPIHRVNLTFRGVALGPGRHEVVFRFRPGSVRLGAGVSVATLLGVILLGVRPRGGKP